MRSIAEIVGNAGNVLETIKDIRTVCDSVEQTHQIDGQTLDVIPEIVSGINDFLYHSKQISVQKLTAKTIMDEDCLSDYITELKQLTDVWETSLTHQLKDGSMDALFWNLYDYFRFVDAGTIYQNAVDQLLQRPQEVKNYLRNMDDFKWLQGKIDDEKKDFSLIRVYADMVKEHVEDFRWLYERLADNRSKMILVKLAQYWFDYDLAWLSRFHENVFKDYFDTDLISCTEEEVLVDCGAFVGDTILDYIDTYGAKYKKIYAYEIIPEIFETLKENTAGMENLVYRQAGVSDQKGTMYIDENVPRGGGSRMAAEGREKIDVVSLDEDIQEPVSIIKMDIEGEEMKALRGSQKHITEQKPKLLISAYHRPADIFDIPRQICGMRDDYKIYLRFNGRVAWPADFVIFAI